MAPVFRPSSDRPANRAALVRLALLCLLALFWLYAKSVFAPWAESAEPRLWLYDTLLYSGFALYAWGLAEIFRLAMIVRKRPGYRSQLARPAALLTLAGLIGLTHHVLHHTGTGWDIRVALSAGPLEPFTMPTYSDRRQRVGWLLLDTARAPCETQSWLWLGRPFGAGSGINRALVFSPGRVPLTPHETGLRFVAIDESWWMAYQNPARYHADPALPAGACRPGRTLASHRQGERFMRRGR